MPCCILSHARKRARDGKISRRLSLELQVSQTGGAPAPLGRRHGLRGPRGDAQGGAAAGACGAVEGLQGRGRGLQPVLAAAGHAAEGEALRDLGRGTGAATEGEPRRAGRTGAGPGETAKGQAAHEVLMLWQGAGWTVILG